MTALCGGGPSESKPGFNGTAVITGAVLDSALVLLGLEGLAAALAPFIAGTVYDLTQLCSTDPPADPGLTATDILDVTNFTDPTVSIPALAKVKQWFESWYWYQACQCSSGTTPTMPAPSNPGGSISINPGLPVPSGVPCWSRTTQVSIAGAGVPPSFVAYGTDVTAQLLPITGPPRTFHVSVPGSVNVAAVPVVAGANNVSFICQIDTPVTDTDVALYITFWDSSGTQLAQSVALIPTGKTGPSSTNLAGTPDTWVTMPSGAAYWGFLLWQADRNAHTVTMTVNFDCASGSLPFSTQPCCPPDPSIDVRLQQIYGLLQSVFQSLPTPLHSYASGTVHSGLSGNGTVTLSAECLAVQVNLTTDSPHLGVASGDPTFLFDRGYIVPVVNSAPVRQPARIVYNPQLFLLPQLTEQVGYSLGVGVVASITELTAGP